MTDPNAPAPKAIGPYSPFVRAGDFVYFSGQIPLDPATGQLVAGGIEAQTAQVLKNLGAVFAAAGVTWAEVVKTTIFLADMNDFAAVNAAYAVPLGDVPPARATVAVAGLPRGARIEIDAVAFAPAGRGVVR